MGCNRSALCGRMSTGHGPRARACGGFDDLRAGAGEIDATVGSSFAEVVKLVRLCLERSGSCADSGDKALHNGKDVRVYGGIVAEGVVAGRAVGVASGGVEMANCGGGVGASVFGVKPACFWDCCEQAEYWVSRIANASRCGTLDAGSREHVYNSGVAAGDRVGTKQRDQVLPRMVQESDCVARGDGVCTSGGDTCVVNGVSGGLSVGSEAMCDGEAEASRCLSTSSEEGFRGSSVELIDEGCSVDDGCGSSMPLSKSDVVGFTDKSGVVHPSKLFRNRADRAIAKDKKLKRKAMGNDWRAGRSKPFGGKVDGRRLESREIVGDGSLRASLEEKWKAENALAVEKARRSLEILKDSDIDQEKRKYRTNISAATERNMVAIEKTHALLKATGNVPEVAGGGFAETVVSGEPGLTDGSISPDSSASMKEFRLCQKKLLDTEALVAKYQAATGWSPEALDCFKKQVWTDTPENHGLLDQLYPEGYGVDGDCESGKFRVIGI